MGKSNQTRAFIAPLPLAGGAGGGPVISIGKAIPSPNSSRKRKGGL